MEDLWGIYGGFMEDLWTIYGWFMEDLLGIYSGFMEDLCKIYGGFRKGFMKDLWRIYGGFMEDLWRNNEHMKIFENQRKKLNTSSKNQWEPQKNPMKNQRRNNEKQWKAKDNFASILSYFWAGIFGPCFFEFSINGERNKGHFEGKNDACLEVPWILYVHKTP